MTTYEVRPYQDAQDESFEKSGLPDADKDDYDSKDKRKLISQLTQLSAEPVIVRARIKEILWDQILVSAGLI